MIKDLIKKNKELIDFYSKTENVNNLNKHLVIAQILSNPKCFFEMEMNTALSILKDLKVENPQQTYLQIISFSNNYN